MIGAHFKYDLSFKQIFFVVRQSATHFGSHCLILEDCGKKFSPLSHHYQCLTIYSHFITLGNKCRWKFLLWQSKLNSLSKWTNFFWQWLTHNEIFSNRIPKWYSDRREDYCLLSSRDYKTNFLLDQFILTVVNNEKMIVEGLTFL